MEQKKTLKFFKFATCREKMSFTRDSKIFIKRHDKLIKSFLFLYCYGAPSEKYFILFTTANFVLKNLVNFFLQYVHRNCVMIEAIWYANIS